MKPYLAVSDFDTRLMFDLVIAVTEGSQDSHDTQDNDNGDL